VESLYSRLVAADSHHFNEEHDPDTDPDPHQSERWSRIRIHINLDPHQRDADPRPFMQCKGVIN
jgi:hypothetical protein